MDTHSDLVPPNGFSPNGKKFSPFPELENFFRNISKHFFEKVFSREKYLALFITRSAQATAMKRVAAPEEIVPMVLYLASDASSYVTGEDFAIGGGMRSN